MATTFPDGIWSADSNTPASLEAITAAMASSIQAALDRRAGPFSGTSTERDAFTNDAPEGTLWVDTNGIKGIYQKAGANWKQVFPVDIPEPEILAIDSGSILMEPSAANTTTSAYVPFAPGRFTKPPQITVTPQTGVPERLDVGFNGRSTSGFTLHMFRTTKVNTRVSWIAMQTPYVDTSD